MLAAMEPKQEIIHPDPGPIVLTTEQRGQFVKFLEGLLTNHQVQRLFKRSELTIMLWRQNEGLPFIRIPGDVRDSIRYDRADVMAWAKAKGKRVHLDGPPVC